jgi:hypothetical protein
MKGLACIPGLKIWTLLLFFAGSLASCNVLTEEEKDCALYVRFKYHMNMNFADALQNAVNSVTVYAFKDGVLAYQRTEEGELLKQNGYRMRIDEIPYREKHKYDYITWAGEPDNESFTIPVLTVGKSTKEDLFCQLNRAGNGVVSTDLEDLFHGMTNGQDYSRSASSAAGDEVVIPLTKNTNNIRIVLQHLSGKPVDVNKLNFTITDKNGLMNYDNMLLGEDVITYKAWHKAQGSAGIGEQQEGVITEVNLALADLTVARLMADEEPILVVTNDEEEMVIRIPLVDYALLYKRLRYEDMPDQEFLDRQDEYNMTFFLDENYRWINQFIYINSWKVVLQESEL